MKRRMRKDARQAKMSEAEVDNAESEQETDCQQWRHADIARRQTAESAIRGDCNGAAERLKHSEEDEHENRKETNWRKKAEQHQQKQALG